MARQQERSVSVEPFCFETALIRIVGTSPFVQNKFSEKQKAKLHADHEAGSTGKKGKAKEKKDFKACYEAAFHRSPEGWVGIPAPAFRSALIRACSLVGIFMTRAKLSLFIEADGFDATDGTPLVKILKGEPEYSELITRNADGSPDLRARPMWREGWEAEVRIQFDPKQFTISDVVNLMARVGAQVGVGEGRHSSPNSNGMGWGCFKLVEGGGDNG